MTEPGRPLSALTRVSILPPAGIDLTVEVELVTTQKRKWRNDRPGVCTPVPDGPPETVVNLWCTGDPLNLADVEHLHAALGQAIVAMKGPS